MLLPGLFLIVLQSAVIRDVCAPKAPLTNFWIDGCYQENEELRFDVSTEPSCNNPFPLYDWAVSMYRCFCKRDYVRSPDNQCVLQAMCSKLL